MGRFKNVVLLNNFMTEQIGFLAPNARKKERNELEISLGTDFVDLDGSEPYPLHLNKAVKLYVGASTLAGIYRGLTEKGDFVLLPFIASVNVPKSFFGSEYRGETSLRYWEKEKPQIVRLGSLNGIDPDNIDDLNMIVEESLPALTAWRNHRKVIIPTEEEYMRAVKVGRRQLER